MRLARRRKAQSAEPDALARAIQRAIDQLLAEGKIKRKFANDPQTNAEPRYGGFCARSVQAYWRLARNPAYSYLAADPEVEPYKLGNGADAHYWIRVKATGKVLDLNLGADQELNPRYRYDLGERRESFQPRIAGSNIPHNNDARLSVERVRRNERPAHTRRGRTPAGL